MTDFILSPVIPDLNVPRGYPCGALVDVNVECGATPSLLYRRVCGVFGHGRDVYLCPIHAAMTACGGTICRECASTGGVVPVKIYLLSEPARIL